MTVKYTTLSQLQTVANGVIAKVRAKGYAVAATTLAGYGITDAYTKTEVDNAIGEAQASVLKPGGSLAASGVVSTLLVAGNLGKVYNLTEDITTTADFVEGAGKAIPAGTNIYIVDTDTTGSSPTYKFDVLAGAYGVATESANGLMSATDKTKLDNADVTAYTGTGAIDVTNHVISIAAATSSAAGSMSAEDKAKLDAADVTAYTGTGAIDITNHVVSVAAAAASTSGVGGNAGTMSATDKEKLDGITTATDTEITELINNLDNL